MKSLKVRYILLLFLISMSAFSGGGGLFFDPTSTPHEILLTAEKYLIDKGISLTEYDIREITYDYVSQMWLISYFGKVGSASGRHFGLQINDINMNDIKLIGGA